MSISAKEWQRQSVSFESLETDVHSKGRSSQLTIDEKSPRKSFLKKSSQSPIQQVTSKGDLYGSCQQITTRLALIAVANIICQKSFELRGHLHDAGS